MFLILCVSFPISVTAQQYAIENIVDRCYAITRALHSADVLPSRTLTEYHRVIEEALKERDSVGLKYVVRDLEDQAVLSLSPVQRAELDHSMSMGGRTINDALIWEVERVRVVVQQREIRNDEEWRVIDGWLRYEESALDLEVEPRSFGEQVELLETLMMEYVREHGNPDGRLRPPTGFLVHTRFTTDRLMARSG